MIDAYLPGLALALVGALALIAAIHTLVSVVGLVLVVLGLVWLVAEFTARHDNRPRRR